jgi:hypothetical protein
MYEIQIVDWSTSDWWTGIDDGGQVNREKEGALQQKHRMRSLGSASGMIIVTALEGET